MLGNKDKFISKSTEIIFNGASWYAGSIFLVVSYFWFRGIERHKKKHARGNFLSEKSFSIIDNILKKSNIKIANICLNKEVETKHFFIHGSSGSGKTMCTRQILNQVRERNQRAVVFDVKGTFVSEYYRKDKDIILSPTDGRCSTWNLWKEINSKSDMISAGDCLIPEIKNTSDPFWREAARMVFVDAADIYAESTDNPKIDGLLNFIFTKGKAGELSKKLKGRISASIIPDEVEKMTGSIIATLASSCNALQYIKDDGVDSKFCIKDWIANEQDNDSWVFLNTGVKDAAMVKPIVTLWLDMAIKSLFSLSENPNRRIWFVFDEFARLQKIPTLETLISMGRGYGGCFVGTIQSIFQLKNIYGEELSRAIIDSLTTQIYFKSNEEKAAEWASNQLGKAEISDVQDSVSMGTHAMRDGVSLSTKKSNENIIYSGEIQSLKPLCGYLKTENKPVHKIKFKPINNVKIDEHFVEGETITRQFELLNKEDKQIKTLSSSGELGIIL